MRKQFRAEVVQVWLWNRSQKEWVWGRYCKVTVWMAAGNGEEEKIPKFFKPKRLSHGLIREEPFGLGHIYLFNIPVSLVLVHQTVWGLCLVRNFVLNWKRNQNSIPNSLLINSSAVWKMPTFPHPMTVRLELECCSSHSLLNKSAGFSLGFWTSKAFGLSFVFRGRYLGLGTLVLSCPMAQLYLTFLHSCAPVWAPCCFPTPCLTLPFPIRRRARSTRLFA